MRVFLVIGFAAIVGVFVVPQTRAANNAAAVVATRQAGFKTIGRSMRDLALQLRSSAPDLAAVRAAARTIQAQSAVLPRWFPTGSGPDTGLKTAAKAEIWANLGVFRKDAADFASAANAMSAASAGTSVDTMRLQMKRLGEACAACHNQFRVRE